MSEEVAVIGPALEVFLTAVGLVLLALVGVALLTRPFWPRIVTYFRRWHERDMRLEQQQREEAECRRKAQQEMREYCHDDILQPQNGQANAGEGSGKTTPVYVQEAAGREELIQEIGSERKGQ